MDMTGKNGQPSMEEILASIRRIIAEEPADAISLDFKPRSGLAPGNGAEHLALDDHSDFELPSMFRATSATPAEKPGPAVKLMDALRATPQLGDTPAARTSPEFPLPLNVSNGSGLVRPDAQAAAAHLALSSLQTGTRTDAASAEPSGQAMPVFVMPAVATVAVDSQSDAAWGAELPMPAASAEPAPATAVARQMVPFGDQHFSRMFGGQIAAAPQAQPEVRTGAPMVQGYTNPAAAPDYVESRATAPAQASSFATLAMQSSDVPPPLTAFAQGSASPAPVQSLVAALRAVEPDASSAPFPASASAGGIEDATAELLRPMLRQWLSDNMPRMVEKALHIEVAESVKPMKKPGSI